MNKIVMHICPEVLNVLLLDIAVSKKIFSNHRFTKTAWPDNTFILSKPSPEVAKSIKVFSDTW